MAVMWCGPFQCGQLMHHTCWWVPWDQSRRLLWSSLSSLWSGRQWMAWYLKGKPKKWAHHYGIALRSFILLSGSDKAAACPSSRAVAGGAWHWASALGSPETGNPARPASHTALRGEWWPVGESWDHKHKAITQKDSMVNPQKPLKPNLEGGCVSWTPSSAWSSVTHHPCVPSPTHSSARSESPSACPCGEQESGLKRSTPCFERFGITPQIISDWHQSLLSPNHGRVWHTGQAGAQDESWALTLPLKPALCSAGGGNHGMILLNSPLRTAPIVPPQSWWAPISTGTSVSLLRKSLLVGRIQWVSTKANLDWVLNHTQSMQNIPQVINAMYFHKWNNYSWLHLLLGHGSDTICAQWCE